MTAHRTHTHTRKHSIAHSHIHSGTPPTLIIICGINTWIAYIFSAEFYVVTFFSILFLMKMPFLHISRHAMRSLQHVCVCVCIYDQIKIIHIIQVNNSNKYLVSIFIWSASLKSCVLMLLLLPLLFTLASAHLQLQIYTQHPWKVFNRKYCHCNMWVHVFMPQTLNSSMV